MTIEPDNEALKRLVAGDHSGPVEAAELAIEGNAGLLNEPAAKAIFLTGVVARMALNAQYRYYKQREQTYNYSNLPLWKKFNGFKITPSKAQALYDEFQHKMRAFGSDLSRDFQGLVASLWLETPSIPTISADTSSLLFTMGLNLGNFFFSKRDKDKENDNE